MTGIHRESLSPNWLTRLQELMELLLQQKDSFLVQSVLESLDDSHVLPHTHYTQGSTATYICTQTHTHIYICKHIDIYGCVCTLLQEFLQSIAFYISDHLEHGLRYYKQKKSGPGPLFSAGFGPASSAHRDHGNLPLL